MSETKLLPCPFCGGKAIVSQDSDGYYVTCKNDCVVQMKSYLEREAINAWNNRKPVERILERLEELYKYNAEQADIYKDGNGAYMREKKEMYMDRANCYGVAIRTVKEEVQYD